MTHRNDEYIKKKLKVLSVNDITGPKKKEKQRRKRKDPPHSQSSGEHHAAALDVRNSFWSRKCPEKKCYNLQYSTKSVIVNSTYCNHDFTRYVKIVYIYIATGISEFASKLS